MEEPKIQDISQCPVETWLSELPRTHDLRFVIDILYFYRPQGSSSGGGRRRWGAETESHEKI